MTDDVDEWRPGSFTKNFGWGAKSDGLRQLWEAIRIGFDNQAINTSRDVFRKRLAHLNISDYIPLNFFLYNKVDAGQSILVVDELVFQAINFKHSQRFDKLAIFAFNLSLVGEWKGARSFQRRPAEWARNYITNRVAEQLNWDTSRVSADDIDQFVSGDSRYKGETSRKLATNYNYLLKLGHIDQFNTKKVESWWLDALFLTLDRVIEDRRYSKKSVNESNYDDYLLSSGFHELSGRRSIAKDLAGKHFINLYQVCGGPKRFLEEYVRDYSALKYPDVQFYSANNPQPVVVVHPSTPASPKAIPRACAMLAKYIGFETLDLDDLDEFDVSEFVRLNTKQALEKLKNNNIKPTMSADELLRLMRGK